MSRRTALITGATGVSGRAMLEHLANHARRDDWDVIAISRRTPDVPGSYRHVAVDLTNREDCRSNLGALREVTHVFFAAYIEPPSEPELTRLNTAILANAVETVESASERLEHVYLVEGTKWYGSHLGPFKTPAKEDDPRPSPQMFYHAQQDWLESAQRGKRWNWSASRPHTICGFSIGNPMNLTMVIAVYAALCKALGLPLAFPGTPGNYRVLYQFTDARLLARAAEWMATTPACANQAFNILNGDLVRWEHLWPRIARYFDLEPGPAQSMRLTAFVADKAPVWDRLVAQHGLKPHLLAEIATWGFGDRVFAPAYDFVSDTTKARLYGFHECVETEAMFFRLWDEFRAARIIPPA